MKNHLRNFCIISHIDHGKSTLADRLLEITKTVEARKMKEQLLDQMDLEREKGITIKLQPVRMEYDYQGEHYIFNLIDTPGHVDFSYEVSRSLAACEGAVLLVDATQGIQAQTIANLYLALEQNLEIIPVINKIDLPNADIEKTTREIEDILGVSADNILQISGKTGQGVEKLLHKIIAQVPPPLENKNGNFRSLIFDSEYDNFQGVISYIRVFEGEVKRGMKVKLFAPNKEIIIEELGVFKPQRVERDKLEAGEVGYLVTGLKEINYCKVGDTICSLGVNKPLPGYKKVKPMVFASFYPVEAGDYPDLREALEKLNLNDSALTFDPESSRALGRGFRLGFLGLLHLEIIQERLKREYELNLVITTPSVSYKVFKKDKTSLIIFNTLDLPDPSAIEKIEEPWMSLDVITPEKYMGGIMDLIKNYRGIYVNSEYLEGRIIIHYEIPLAEIITDFYDKLKSVSQGFASMNYEILSWRQADLIKLDILVAGENVEALSRMVLRRKAHEEGKFLVTRLKKYIPAQNFQVAIQAAIGGKIIARETVKALRKDVTAKLYGGDVTRKRKLLEKQKKGKKKMKSFGRVEIPQEAFLSVLKKD